MPHPSPLVSRKLALWTSGGTASYSMKPAIIIVHGAWHVPEHFRAFAEMLKASGYDVIIPHLPSCGELAAKSTLDDDVSKVQTEMAKLVDESRQVLVLAHSYGGAVATQALERRNLREAVVHLVYMCGFMLTPGQSCASSIQPRPVPDPIEPGDDGTSFLGMSPKELFYADVEEQAAKVAEALLVRHSLAALAGPISYPAWRHLPTSYLRCTEDMAIPLVWQDKFIEAVKNSGVDIEVTTYKASHSPFLSMPEQMVAAVKRVAERYEVTSS